MKQSWDVQIGKKWSHLPSVGWSFLECTMGAPQPAIRFELSGGQRSSRNDYCLSFPAVQHQLKGKDKVGPMRAWDEGE